MAEPMISTYDGMSGFQISRLSAAERERRWEADRRTVADRWFNGDVSKADEALGALPFSAIPVWTDLDALCGIILESGDSEKGADRG